MIDVNNPFKCNIKYSRYCTTWWLVDYCIKNTLCNLHGAIYMVQSRWWQWWWWRLHHLVGDCTTRALGAAKQPDLRQSRHQPPSLPPSTNGATLPPPYANCMITIIIGILLAMRKLLISIVMNTFDDLEYFYTFCGKTPSHIYHWENKNYGKILRTAEIILPTNKKSATKALCLNIKYLYSHNDFEWETVKMLIQLKITVTFFIWN